LEPYAHGCARYTLWGIVINLYSAVTVWLSFIQGCLIWVHLTSLSNLAVVSKVWKGKCYTSVKSVHSIPFYTKISSSAVHFCQHSWHL